MCTWWRSLLRVVLLTSLLIGLTGVFPDLVQAQAPPSNQQQQTSGTDLLLDKPTHLPKLFERLGGSIGPLWDIVIGASGVVFLVLLLVGGVQYMTASGNDEQGKKAKTLLTEAVIGIVLVVIAWPVGVYILRLLGISEQVTGDKTIASTTTSSNPANGPIAQTTQTVVLKSPTPQANVVYIYQVTGGVVSFNLPSAPTAPGFIPVAYAASTSTVGQEFKVHTNNAGIAQVPDRPVGERFRVFIEKTNGKRVLVVNDREVQDGDNTIPVPTENGEDLVRIRVAVYSHLRPSSALRNYNVVLRNGTDGTTVSATTGSTASDAYAEPLLDPSTTYYLAGGDGEVTKGQADSFAVPDGPKGTENPAATWTLFVTPSADFSEDGTTTTSTEGAVIIDSQDSVSITYGYSLNSQSEHYRFILGEEKWYWYTGQDVTYVPVDELPSTLSAERRAFILEGLTAVKQRHYGGSSN